MNKQSRATYRSQSLQNASGAELVAACFREAQVQLAAARGQIVAGTGASSYTPLERVRKIYTHLYGTLNLDDGGELAQRMQSLYAFVIEQTMTVASSYDLEGLDVMDKINSDMLGAWSRIAVREAPREGAPNGSFRVSG